jgi:uncharacterized protein
MANLCACDLRQHAPSGKNDDPRADSYRGGAKRAPSDLKNMKSNKKRAGSPPKLASSHRGAVAVNAAARAAQAVTTVASNGSVPSKNAVGAGQALTTSPKATALKADAKPQHAVAHELSISIGDLDAGGRAYRFPLRHAWLLGVLEGNEAQPTGADGLFTVRVSKSGDDVAAVGKIAATLSAPCARCQEPATFTVAADFSVLFVPASAIADPRGDYEFSAGESDLIAYVGDELVFDDFVRDELVLETPMISLCSEACEGMKPNLYGAAAAESSVASRAGVRLSTSHNGSHHGNNHDAPISAGSSGGPKGIGPAGAGNREPNSHSPLDPKASDSSASSTKPLDPRLAPLLKFQLKKPS